jgi:hypothetical protein
MNDPVVAILLLAAWVVVGVLGALWKGREDDEDVSLLSVLGAVCIAPAFLFVAIFVLLHSVKLVRRETNQETPK